MNDINAPSSSTIDTFALPKGVEWGEEERQLFAGWDYFNQEAWEGEEAQYRIKKFRELSGGIGKGGGCCTLA